MSNHLKVLEHLKDVKLTAVERPDDARYLQTTLKCKSYDDLGDLLVELTAGVHVIGDMMRENTHEVDNDTIGQGLTGITRVLKAIAFELKCDFHALDKVWKLQNDELKI